MVQEPGVALGDLRKERDLGHSCSENAKVLMSFTVHIPQIQIFLSRKIREVQWKNKFMPSGKKQEQIQKLT